MSERTEWLRQVADSIDQQLLDAVYDMDMQIDSEWGSGRSAQQIEADDDEDSDAVRLIATRYADHSGYREGWGK